MKARDTVGAETRLTDDAAGRGAEHAMQASLRQLRPQCIEVAGRGSKYHAGRTVDMISGNRRGDLGRASLRAEGDDGRTVTHFLLPRSPAARRQNLLPNIPGRGVQLQKVCRPRRDAARRDESSPKWSLGARRIRCGECA